MSISEAGKITESITLLGRPETCVYLVSSGDESILIGGGMAYIAPDVVWQIKKFGIDEKKINRMIILHSHFDHCGLIPYCKKCWPWSAVTASKRAKKILSDEKISKVIWDLNQTAIKNEGLEERAENINYSFNTVGVEETVGEGDVISCGDLTLEIMDVPGHSSCSIAVYIPEEKALFASDAAGVRCNDFSIAAGNSNFDQYQQSLEKMASYGVNVMLTEHYGAYVGEEAHSFLPYAIEVARKTRVLMEESYRRTGDLKKSTEEISKLLSKDAPDFFLSLGVISMVVGMMLKYIAKTLNNNSHVKLEE